MDTEKGDVLFVGQCLPRAGAIRRVRGLLAAEGLGLWRTASQDAASLWLCTRRPGVVFIDLTLRDGSPLAVADFCHYRRPSTPVVLVGEDKLLADGSLFRHVGNAAALISAETSPGDLVALAIHHARPRLARA